uniref:Uncharacterized protein n=1 Tax=Chenopodium quinoa TaxID=63459 RepID=A0A803MVQ1_CHEQI
MYRWLIDSFDCGSCMFSIGNNKEFVVNEYDVFCLPLNPKNVEEIPRSANNPDFIFKHNWRLHFGLTDKNDQIPLNLLEARIPTLGQGGDEFKQLFVMHAISTGKYGECWGSDNVVRNVGRSVDVPDSQGTIQFIRPAGSMSDQEIHSAAIDIFLPCLWGNQYCLFVVNLTEGKIQFIDNLNYDEDNRMFLKKLSSLLNFMAVVMLPVMIAGVWLSSDLLLGCDMISTFFDQRLTQSGDMVDYALEFPTLNWRSSKDNSDFGVYIMMSMLLFNGVDEFKCEVVKTASNRKILRIQIAASLVLSDMNEARSIIIDKVAEFKLDR